MTDTLINTLYSGVKLVDESEILSATACKKISDHQLEMAIEQGKYHQVKRMLAAAGNHCSALQRIAIGELKLADLELEEGQWCFLNQTDLLKLTTVHSS